jgi:HSP20 family protein
MGKSQWLQWRSVDEIREQMDRMLDSASQGPSMPGAPGYAWLPLADITETAQALVVRMELPGVSQEQLLVEVADGALIIRGERPSEREEPDTVFHLMERAHGSFARRFPLPEDVHGEGISALLREGLLTVTVPKRSPAVPARRSLIPE